MISGKRFLAASLAAFLGAEILSSAQTNTPDFQEIYNLVRAHAAMNDAELNRAAVRGFLAALGSKASLVTNGTAETASAAAPPVSQSRIFERNIGYLRIARVGGDLAEIVRRTFGDWSATNKLSGIVLDLRYADGDDYDAAAKLADEFLRKAEPLLNWGGGMVSSHEKTNAIPVPVAMMVNHQTAGAAEALAAVLRQADAGIVLGTQTAGRATVMKDFPLTNGLALRIATAPVTLGNGSALPMEGVKPDIEVTVSAQNERAYFANPFLVVPATNLVGAATSEAGGTNFAPRRIHINEAELVRAHKEGIDLEAEPEAAPPPPPQKPVVTDPVLARALDLLKGLAVVRQNNK